MDVHHGMRRMVAAFIIIFEVESVFIINIIARIEPFRVYLPAIGDSAMRTRFHRVITAYQEAKGIAYPILLSVEYFAREHRVICITI